MISAICVIFIDTDGIFLLQTGFLHVRQHEKTVRIALRKMKQNTTKQKAQTRWGY